MHEHHQPQRGSHYVVALAPAARRLQITPAEFGAVGVPIEAPVVAAQPADACQPLSNERALRDKVGLVLRGGCLFQEKALQLLCAHQVLSALA